MRKGVGSGARALAAVQGRWQRGKGVGNGIRRGIKAAGSVHGGYKCGGCKAHRHTMGAGLLGQRHGAGGVDGAASLLGKGRADGRHNAARLRVVSKLSRVRSTDAIEVGFVCMCAKTDGKVLALKPLFCRSSRPAITAVPDTSSLPASGIWVHKRTSK